LLVSDQPLKSYPVRVGAVGADNVALVKTVVLETEEPPCELKVTFRVTEYLITTMPADPFPPVLEVLKVPPPAPPPPEPVFAVADEPDAFKPPPLPPMLEPPVPPVLSEPPPPPAATVEIVTELTLIPVNGLVVPVPPAPPLVPLPCDPADP
jgi:hypothetical protein